MSELELTYEHYAYTLTKAGLTPPPQEVFDTPDGNMICRLLYATVVQTIQDRFQEDLKVFEEMPDEEPEDEDDWSDYFDGDVCPNCGRSETRRIDIITSDPNVWACECFTCGEHFEVI